MDRGLDTSGQEKISLLTVPVSGLQDMSKRLLSLTREERKKVRGLEPERADLIIPGIQFTINLMDACGFTELIITDNGLLEGALFEIAKETDEKNIRKTEQS